MRACRTPSTIFHALSWARICPFFTHSPSFTRTRFTVPGTMENTVAWMRGSTVPVSWSDSAIGPDPTVSTFTNNGGWPFRFCLAASTFSSIAASYWWWISMPIPARTMIANTTLPIRLSISYLPPRVDAAERLARGDQITHGGIETCSRGIESVECVDVLSSRTVVTGLGVQQIRSRLHALPESAPLQPKRHGGLLHGNSG